MAIAPGVDTTLMLTIAEASATFVAIVAGFFTTKIISISGDKKRLRSKIAEVDVEIGSRRNLVERYKDNADDIAIRWAEETIDDFVDRLLNEDDLKVYTIDELKIKFTDLEGQEPDMYESDVIEAKYEEIKRKIEAELERVPQPGFMKMPGFGGLFARTFKLPEQIRAEREEYDENVEKFIIEDNEIKRLTSMKKHYEGELQGSEFPVHMAFGFMSQIIFAFLGVLIPLTYGSWSEYFGDGVRANIFAIAMFVVGLVLTFVYLSLEIRDAIRA